MTPPAKIALIAQPGEAGHHNSFMALARRLAVTWPVAFVGFADDRGVFEPSLPRRTHQLSLGLV